MTFEETASSKLLAQLNEQQKQRDLLKRQRYIGSSKSIFDAAMQAANSPTLADRAFEAQLRLDSELFSTAAGRASIPSQRNYMQSAVSQIAPTRRHNSASPFRQVNRASDLGFLIRNARKKLRMSQSTFAAHAGVGRRFLSELESGKASLEFDKVVACATAAGLDLFAQPRDGS